MSGILQLINTFPSGGFAVKNSLRFRSSASAYLSRTPASAGNRTTWTYSVWHKRGQIGTSYSWLMNAYNTTQDALDFNGDRLDFWLADAVSIRLTSTAVFRDPSAWYHIVLAFDSTQTTASNRIKMYVNGVQITSFFIANYPSQNYQCPNINNTVQNEIGYISGGTDGYMAEINFIDGQALTPSSFGAFDATSGVWQPVKYSGTYGTNGFYLKFSDTNSTTTLCYDYSGSGNNWTPNNISLTSGSTYDSMLDSPTNYDNGGTGVGNYAVLNPLNLTSPSTLSAGNLNFDTGVSGGGGVYANWQFPSSEKYYFELSNLSGVGTANGRALCANTLWESNTGNLYIDGNLAANIGTYADGDTLSWATDCAAKTVAIRKNNTLIYTASAGTGLYLEPIFGFRDGSGSGGITGSINFGQRPFSYTPPSGYKALNTQNLPAASIVNGASFMAATLYTGNGSTQSIVNAYNGVSFQPDFVWLKGRSNSSKNNLLDTIRGRASLFSDTTEAELALNSGYDFLTFNSNGFTLGTPQQTAINNTGQTYVGWSWKANGTAVSNTAGSITSQVSANTTAGFSVVTYSAGASNSTVGHGLGTAPSFIIVKSRTTTNSWPIYHASLGRNQYLFLNTTDAAGTIADYWGTSGPSSATFGISNNGYLNNVGNLVAYCFAAIPGYSAFGSYTGNGSSDGPFVFLGFRPKYVLLKRTDSTADWTVWDTSRNPYNVSTTVLCPNLSSAESAFSSGYDFDILSNGFKCRSTGNVENVSGGTYIYAAFAENPLKYSLAR